MTEGEDRSRGRRKILLGLLVLVAFLAISLADPLFNPPGSSSDGGRDGTRVAWTWTDSSSAVAALRNPDAGGERVMGSDSKPSSVAPAIGAGPSPLFHRDACPDNCPDSTISGRLQYEDSGGGVPPIRRALVEIWDRDPIGDDFMGATFTDDTGSFQVTFENYADCTFLDLLPHCPYADDTVGEDRRTDAYAVVFSFHPDIADVFCPLSACPIPEDLKQTYHFKFPVINDMADGDVDYGTQTVPFATDHGKALGIFDVLVTAWDFIATNSGFRVPRVGVHLPCESGIPLCPQRDYFDVYVTHNLNLKFADVDNPGTVVHEYGHFVMFKAYDDAWPIWPDVQVGTIGGSNFFNTDCLYHRNPLPVGCALSEGWADFLEFTVVFGGLESPARGTAPGDVWEDRVAGALWDAIDRADDGFDTFAAPFADVMDTLVSAGRSGCAFWVDPPLGDQCLSNQRSFREFYDQWLARGHDPRVLNAASFQNLIDYNNAPRITSVRVPALAGGGLIDIGATGADDAGGYIDGDIVRAEFEYSLDGGANWVPLGIASAADGLTFQWLTTGLNEPSVLVKARVRDNLGALSMELVSHPFIIDNAPPDLTVPGEIIEEATGPAGAVVVFTASATDNFGPVTVTCAPASGSVFPIGETEVRCTAVDAAGNEDTGFFSVFVADTTPPVVTPPPDVVAEAMGPSGAAVTYPPATASDAVGIGSGPTCSPASGSTFPLGTTVVTCTAVDSSGNGGSATFTVTVRDTTPPIVAMPAPITAEATGPAGAAVTFSASATDLVDGPVPTSCAPASGSTFPLGTTVVMCTGTDSHGNTGAASFPVTVVDTTPPVLTLVGSPTVRLLVGETYVEPGATAFDIVDGDLTSAIVISGTVDTSRSGTYTITYSVTDAAGNRAEITRTVTVITAVQATQDLLDRARASGLPAEVISLLEHALRLLGDGSAANDNGACGFLESFIQQVTRLARAGRISAEGAADLIREAERIQVSLGCAVARTSGFLADGGAFASLTAALQAIAPYAVPLTAVLVIAGAAIRLRREPGRREEAGRATEQGVGSEGAAEADREHFLLHAQIRRTAEEIRSLLESLREYGMPVGRLRHRARQIRDLLASHRCFEAARELEDLHALCVGYLSLRGNG